ncbi:MAG: ABC transporter permease, partial [Planctomycetaceae bacterium]|nr:ABC transporter permease [Planctomycetaceae bacterium]
VTALVAIRHITVYSELQVARQLESLGANILILPKQASLQDYYAADMSEHRLPEEYVAQVMLAGLPGVEKLAPKLCLTTVCQDQQVVVTGILPQEDLRANQVWQTVGLLQQRKHVGCTKVHADDADDKSPEALATRRTITQLGQRETVLGADVAQRLKAGKGDHIAIFGESFRVASVLPATGTVDDGRVFAHLHAIQELAKLGEVVSAIEVMGCCEDAAGQLVPQLSELLPTAKIVTISQVVHTQVGVNRLMAATSWFVLGTLVLVGIASTASAISANVRERRREIGTLMALGASPQFIKRLFLWKATSVGTLGGLAGCALGILLAVLIGPAWLGVVVSPLWGLSSLSIVAALGVAFVAAYWPAKRAAHLDPCTCFQEV